MTQDTHRTLQCEGLVFRIFAPGLTPDELDQIRAMLKVASDWKELGNIDPIRHRKEVQRRLDRFQTLRGLRLDMTALVQAYAAEYSDCTPLGHYMRRERYG